MSPKKRITMHDHAAEASLFKRRALFTFFCVFALLSVLVTNLYHLQVESYKDYETRSNDNRIRVVPIAPSRGLIYDRNGVLLAENLPFYSLDLVPEKISNMSETLDELGKLIEISEDERETFTEALKFHRRFKPLTLKNQLTEEQVAIFSVNQHKFPGISVEAGLKRNYPYGAQITHVLGYVGKINTRDRAQLERSDLWKNYAATKDIGKQGIEKFYESLLHGKPGHLEEEVNNRGRAIRTLKIVPPEPGQDIYLTLDLKLQQKAVELLTGLRGSIVAIDPRDGGVLAMVSSPSYDPNQFVQGINNKDYSALLNDKSRPLINRATQGQYAPASTIKPHLALLGLDEKVITESTRVWDPGFWQIPGVERKYRDWRRWGHGWVNVYSAITESCDTFFYELAYKVGVDHIARFMEQFGFGQNTGIDIFEESSGNMPSKEWKRLKYNQAWYIGDTISVGIGQGYWTATPLQLANAVGIMANKGRRFPPHLLKSIKDNTAKIDSPINELPPIELNSPRNWNIINEAMRQTANKSRFTDATYTAAMKTGTAQVIGVAENTKYDASKIAEHFRDNALVVAYAPFEDPKIVLAVVMENAGWGGANAGPVARAMLDEYMLRDTWKPQP
ncbi:penicillin-binding protein 2 [Shewanella baltica]|uniref:Peptidoglycan D,D-transpeptidase MrdA n=2 Tax=Shewanella baltica TaxID=62322 RepID=A9L007_SHEB9|nr:MULTISPECIES: penicillin-binding protein 2 [Shewanella]MCI2961854.1 penicillin-binding protein 2 [Shewanella sp. N2AIL]ABN62755.1 peptidoglycan glycosyltransferase [Shewanella baltica OS155]ABS09444.1 Peptidoglycan glycosyltransferase [Shewanella baltica OS185]ABX50615.1 penicillin-binding protein 2 [Shewanella baltica OS195]ACK45607.1 penicillin-binding protein 2 [Shewanella baltica OS223]